MQMGGTERSGHSVYTLALIWVLKDNPSKRFYEALGCNEVQRQEIEIGGKKLQEIADWLDI
ncbi:hypothetical protein ACHHV8_20555 [Paenibacillus sp. TAB 01]|uniref:hypothetical protein n=1 Tax=Paenibacillus sp. TAB 01 TaxID=3368988 RepID=UPI00375238FF